MKLVALRLLWFVFLDGLLIYIFSRGEMMIPDWFVLGITGFIAALIIADALTLYRARRPARTDSKETA